jgi:hypothetical protein
MEFASSAVQFGPATGRRCSQLDFPRPDLGGLARPGFAATSFSTEKALSLAMPNSAHGDAEVRDDHAPDRQRRAPQGDRPRSGSRLAIAKSHCQSKADERQHIKLRPYGKANCGKTHQRGRNDQAQAHARERIAPPAQQRPHGHDDQHRHDEQSPHSTCEFSARLLRPLCDR